MTADQLVEELCRHYHLLSEELRAELPLKQVWTVVQDDDHAIRSNSRRAFGDAAMTWTMPITQDLTISKTDH